MQMLISYDVMRQKKVFAIEIEDSDLLTIDLNPLERVALIELSGNRSSLSQKILALHILASKLEESIHLSQVSKRQAQI